MHSRIGVWITTLAAAGLAWSCGAQTEEELRGPFKRWLDEDVLYIIASEEREAFVQLTTDEEREHFIESFWTRRDPTPDSTANEYKEEHYRRIAYANDRFAWHVPGWQTDRGRTYVTKGRRTRSNPTPRAASIGRCPAKTVGSPPTTRSRSGGTVGPTATEARAS